MSKSLNLTNTIKKLRFFFSYHFIKNKRRLSILFSRKRKLTQVRFNYFNHWHFDNAYLIVDFEFKNEVSYKIENEKFTSSKLPIVLNLQNINKEVIYLEVFGFFQKQKLPIYINKENSINTELLKAKLHNLSGFDLSLQYIYLEKKHITLNPQRTYLDFPKVSLEHSSIKINHTNFKTKDYI